MGEAEVEALEAGRAFVDLSAWWKVAVAGPDAIRWLNDLVSNRIDDIGENEARRTLLLDRTGRIKADLHAVPVGDRDGGSGLLLLQDPAQPERVDALLGPYQLSSDVELVDWTDRISWFVVNQSGIAEVQFMQWPGIEDRTAYAIVETDQGERVRDVLAGSYKEALEPDVEIWRIRRGIPRVGVDVGGDATPPELGWEPLVDRTKGCFLGQEAVAKIANLGHPAKLVVSLGTDGPPTPGETIHADGETVGRVTGVAPDRAGFAVLARIRWEAQGASLVTASGKPLLRRATGSAMRAR